MLFSESWQMRPSSRALPGYAYGDPAKIVEAQELRSLGCKACARADYILGLPVCASGLKFPACRSVPRNGYKLTTEAGG